MAGWPNLSELLVSPTRRTAVGLLGAPLVAGSVTPGACDLAPELLRRTLRRIGRYDVETGRELETEIADRGDVELAGLSIEDATPLIREAVAASAEAHALTLLVGGNNAVTRPAVLGLGGDLGEIGLITLDAHFDMRDLDQGLSNGNPVRALLADGLPGANVAQVGLASFANSRAMHEDATEAGNLVITIEDVRESGIAPRDRSRARPCRPLRRAGDRLRHRRDRPIAISGGAGRPRRRNGGARLLSTRCAGSRPTRACTSSISPNGIRRSIRPTSAL